MSVSHWTRSRPILEVVEAAFAQAIFIGLQLPSDGHTRRWECGYPGCVELHSVSEGWRAIECVGCAGRS
jgi:hypothetical protein